MRTALCVSFVISLMLISARTANAEQCVPDCQGKECGDDGCGGSSGECASNKDCVLGHCVYGCGSIGGRGCCYGDYLLWCEYSKNKLWVHNCAERGLTCGWDGALYGYACVPPPGLPDPKGEYPMQCDFNCYPYCPEEYECGNDGCGGVCGECEPGRVCGQRKCCTPSCEGKECGSDGCLGWCGDCPEGFWCTDFYRCAYGYGCVPTKTPGCRSCACLRCVCDIVAKWSGIADALTFATTIAVGVYLALRHAVIGSADLMGADGYVGNALKERYAGMAIACLQVNLSLLNKQKM